MDNDDRLLNVYSQLIDNVNESFNNTLNLYDHIQNSIRNTYRSRTNNNNANQFRNTNQLRIHVSDG